MILPVTIPPMLVGTMIAPAVLISAAGLLLLGASNRYGRIIDRLRHLSVLLREKPGPDREYLESEHRSIVFRAKRTWLALTLLHSAVLLFVLESLLLGLNTICDLHFLTVIGDGVIVVGMLLFGGASLSLIHEATEALETIRREETFAAPKIRTD